MLTITPLQSAGATQIYPDLVWNGFVGDLALDSNTGLQAQHSLHTAIIMLLFTDAKCAPEELKSEFNGDRRGWAGDSFDIDKTNGETELGSKLWLYRRHELTDETARQIEFEVRRALQPLLNQHVVAKMNIVAQTVKTQSRINLTIELFGRDGGILHAPKFDLLWSDIAANPVTTKSPVF